MSFSLYPEFSVFYPELIAVSKSVVTLWALLCTPNNIGKNYITLNLSIICYNCKDI